MREWERVADDTRTGTEFAEEFPLKSRHHVRYAIHRNNIEVRKILVPEISPINADVIRHSRAMRAHTRPGNEEWINFVSNCLSTLLSCFNKKSPIAAPNVNEFLAWLNLRYFEHSLHTFIGRRHVMRAGEYAEEIGAD